MTENSAPSTAQGGHVQLGDAEGYLAVPESGSGPGVVVIQEWWGMDAHIEDVADRFAAAGFVALAPDLYHGKDDPRARRGRAS